MIGISRFLAGLACLGLLLAPPLATAAPARAVSPWLYQQLQDAEKLMERSAYGEAEQKLKAALAKVSEQSYEQAVALRALSSLYAVQERYAKAADALAASVATKALSDSQNQAAMLTLGQLYAAAEDYKTAVAALEKWLADGGKASAETSILLANAYLQLKQYRKALPHVRKAIAASPKPDESWYRLLLALHFELAQYREGAQVLQTLIRLYPDNPYYWEQLAGVYQQLKDYTRAAAIKELAYRKGLFEEEKALIDLVKLLLYINAPYRGGRLLEQEIQNGRVAPTAHNWELLASAWSQAREFERAAKALEQAARRGDSGKIYARLGRIQVEQENWKDARASLTKALQKGGLADAGEVYILLGLSHFELGDKVSARKAFAQAVRFKKNQKTARQWLNYIDSDD